jgi:hypothetical protein
MHLQEEAYSVTFMEEFYCQTLVIDISMIGTCHV